MARSTGEARDRADQPMTDDQPGRSAAGQSEGDSADAIRRRAYELFESRGGAGGSEMDDWLAAEREVRAGSVIAPMGDRGPQSGATTGVTTAAAGTEGAASAASALGGESGDASEAATSEAATSEAATGEAVTSQASAGEAAAGETPAGSQGPATRRSRRGRTG